MDKIGPEDCRAGGFSFCSLSLKSCRHEVIASHMEILKFTIEDKRKQLQSWKSNVCHIDRVHNVVHDSLVFVERVRKHVHFNPSTAFIDSCRSHVNRRDKRQHNHDDDKRISTTMLLF